MPGSAGTLNEWRRGAFVWGETDCIMATCNHVRAVTGIDPAGPWRGSYDDEAGAQAIYKPYGGVLALFKHGMARAGFQMTDAPKDGDPVVCDVRGVEVAGVYLGNRRVAFMAAGRGCIELPAPILGAWSV